MPKSTTTAVVDNQESWRLLEGHQPGRPVQVHGCTGTLVMITEGGSKMQMIEAAIEKQHYTIVYCR